MKSKLVLNRTLSRRDMLKLMGLGTAGAILAGCAPKATETAAPAIVTEATESPNGWHLRK
jgi:hypothetical protein